jgi:hypothetical protein
MNTRTITMTGLALLAVGCSGSGSGVTADLPSEWNTARSVQRFTQATCSGSPLDPAATPEAIDVTVAAGSIHVAYHDAHFRCEQVVEGFRPHGFEDRGLSRAAH